MIDISTEKLVSFTQATKTLPQRRGGKRPHVATLYRWAQRGHKGIRLESLQIGGCKCTSMEALQRFFDRLSGAPQADVQAAGLNSRPDTTLGHSRAIERQLEAEGL